MDKLFQPIFATQATMSIANLERRVRMQRDALLQAEADLSAAQAREGLGPLLEPLVEDGEPTRGPVGEMARIRDDAERRRRGLGPGVRVTAAEILAAAKKARGEK